MTPAHVVIDGSNIATEGRSQPSLHQLREAVAAFAAEHPGAKLSIVVDATFGHRIDPAEVAEFDAAVANNELVAPPAGAIGRGDAFVLGIADKVNAVVLSNDSYQEFHGQYDWLFDEGRLVGGKPVPHVGWVFVNRLPVRGPLSRKSVSEAKRKGRRNTGPTSRDTGDGTVRVGSAAANKPMPVPTTPPPGAVLGSATKNAGKSAGKSEDKAAGKGKGAGKGATAAKAAKGSRGKGAAGSTAPAPKAAPSESASNQSARASSRGPLNDLLEYLGFVERHPVGSPVDAVVDHYSSHGAYVRADGLLAYVPLRLMADPAPRSAREFGKIGSTVAVVVHQYHPATRSVDLAVPEFGAPRRGAAAAGLADGLRKVAGTTARGATTKAAKKTGAATAAAPTKKSAGATTATKQPATKPTAASSTKAAATKGRAKKAAAAAPAKKAAAATSPAKQAGAATKAGRKATPAKKAAPATAPTKKGPAKKGPAKKAATAKTPAKAPAKRAASRSAAKKSR